MGSTTSTETETQTAGKSAAGTETETAATRLGGRKAEAARNDRIVLDAAREVFYELGFDAPMSAIAERAGVGMGSLYRRYRSKEELIQRLCVVSMECTLEVAERARAEEPDGWAALVRFMREGVEGGAGSLGRFAGSFPATQSMVETSLRASLVMHELIERAQTEGHLRPDVTTADLTFVFELLRTQLSPDRERAKELRERYLMALMDGLRARGEERLPGPAPDWPEIAERWGSPADAD
jgi:AcrR family transcriptional regulator